MTVLDWLLDADPGIRWQAMAGLTDASPQTLAAERSRVAAEGWGHETLARQLADGTWPIEPGNDQWTATPEGSAFVALVWLRELGLDPASSEAVHAAELVRDHVTWHWFDDRPFFAGEVEPCINGRVVAVGAYFGQDVSNLVERLLGEQMADGGWNCEQENGSTRGSFNTTIDVLEGLLEFERANGGDLDVSRARERADAYLLDRRLLRRLSTGEIIDPAFTQLAFPPGYHYDVLRGLDHLRLADVRDPRAAEAVELLDGKRQPDGRWRLDSERERFLAMGHHERVGESSRWITLRALQVLRWWEDGQG